MKQKRVLLVDDDETITHLFRDSLGDLSAEPEVETAPSGEAALRLMEQKAWDLVVTDYMMPGITGLELIETLKERAPATRTILITAYGSDQIEQAAQQLNVYRYMTKPFPLADLKRVVCEALALG